MNSATKITDLNEQDAKLFFLKNKSYASMDLPAYFCFEELLGKLSNELNGQSLHQTLGSQSLKNMKDTLGINHIIYANKDGNLSWRPLQLIHPLAYLALVNQITEKANWKKIQKRFRAFAKNDKIICLSIPVQSNTQQSDKAEQILQWWEGIEQESISLALEYQYIFDTDIADCYGSIYTHSIAWAIDGIKKAKTRKYRNNENELGVKIDTCIQQMQGRQTNGIPQGSILMDFIAEILLGYIDAILYFQLKGKNISEYKILRYRDDYRIFVQNKTDGENIVRILSEILQPFGLKLNSSKTKGGNDIITNSIKPDKLAFLKLPKEKENIQKKLLMLREFGKDYPNSGSLVRALADLIQNSNSLKESLVKIKSPYEIKAITSILIDIAFHNPETLPICCSLIGEMLSLKEDNSSLAKIVFYKLKEIPNSGFAQIWLQRLFKNDLTHYLFNEKLCQQVDKTKNSWDLWDTSWLDCSDNNSSKIKIMDIMKNTSIICWDIFNNLPDIINFSEIRLFTNYPIYSEAEIDEIFSIVE